MQTICLFIYNKSHVTTNNVDFSIPYFKTRAWMVATWWINIYKYQSIAIIKILCSFFHPWCVVWREKMRKKVEWEKKTRKKKLMKKNVEGSFIFEKLKKKIFGSNLEQRPVGFAMVLSKRNRVPWGSMGHGPNIQV